MSYKPAILDCPICGEHIEGDMPVISHAIRGCSPPKIKELTTPVKKDETISEQLNRTQME